MNLAVNFLKADSVIQTFGLAGIFVILFAETGLLIGFFLPGDSLLFTAGLFASTGATAAVHLSLPVLLIGCPVAAILGAQVGYLIGRRAGPVLFDRTDNKPFKREYVDRAEHYFDRYGAGKAVVLARFVPIIRTFMNPMAGVLEMPARTFTLWNVVGGLVWTELVLVLGYTLGKSVKGIDKYLLPIVAVIVVLSLLPVFREISKARRR
ncbi:MAG: VTT domain-containing protein [Actinomycetota bacterium]|nr:VTT domain-containing protein [Actinomycetota bacterium]